VTKLTIVFATIKRTRQQQLGGRAAQTAYFLLAAVLPSLMIIVTLVGSLSVWDNGAWLETLMGMGLPPVISEPLLSEIEKITVGPIGKKVVLSGLVGLYLSVRAIDSMLQGVNTAWGLRDHRPWHKQMLRVLLLTTFIITGFCGILIMLAMGARVREWLQLYGQISQQLSILVLYMRWPAVMLIIHQIVWVIYRFGAERGIGKRWITWGSLVATISLLSVIAGFKMYVEQVADLGATFGSLGTAMGIAILCYLCTFTVLIGASLDCEIKRQNESS